MRDGILRGLLHPYQIILIAATGLFLLSGFFERLRWIQPLMFIVLSPVSIISDAQSIYGLGFFVMGVILLERAGFFVKRRSIKFFIVLSYLLVIEIVAVVVSKRPIADAVSPTFFIAAFGLFLWFLYNDKLVTMLKEPRPSVSLVDKGLSAAERSFVLLTLAGKSHKEIAVEFDLKESTVRNTLARAYKKLGVEDRVGLAIIGERYEILG
ncbi:MAG: helix-turn-helix transcriptional regulator [Spirochaetes bacterium]|nr:helix-turn-helix transcriptional regulator [Spirochaetota bacterium]MBU1079244.1 helix-turn-helix transcriptional regulator [Spirochaetota bacterium]